MMIIMIRIIRTKVKNGQYGNAMAKKLIMMMMMMMIIIIMMMILIGLIILMILILMMIMMCKRPTWARPPMISS